MNPIILSIAVLYITILITKGLFSSKELQRNLPSYLANIIIFIQNNATNIIFTVAIMLSIIVYFTIIGVDLNTKSKLRLKRTIVYEGFKPEGGILMDAKAIFNNDQFPAFPEVDEYETIEDEVDTFLSRKGGIKGQDKHCKLLSSMNDCMKSSFCTWCGDTEKGECHKGGLNGPTFFPTLKKNNNNFKCDEYYFRGISKKPTLYKRDNSYKIE